MEAFWDDFSVDKKHLGYTAILNRLENRRIAENHRLVALAKEEYGDSFADTFKYRRAGAWVTKTKASDIATQYRELHNMEAEDDSDNE